MARVLLAILLISLIGLALLLLNQENNTQTFHGIIDNKPSNSETTEVLLKLSRKHDINSKEKECNKFIEYYEKGLKNQKTEFLKKDLRERLEERKELCNVLY